MLGKLTHLKWASAQGGNRDLAFVIFILVFGMILILKLAPYYKSSEQSIAYNKVQTMPSVPKSLLEKITFPLTETFKSRSDRVGHVPSQTTAQNGNQRPSVLERLLFDGQMVTFKVRSLNSYASTNSNQPIEVQILNPAGKDESEIDLTPAMGAKLVGAGSANLSAKRLNISFTELVTADNRSYAVQGLAIGSTDLTPGIEGDYSSGLTSRIAGIALDRTIMAADQVGTAYVLSAFGPTGYAAQNVSAAAMETNQQASSNISAAATQGLRETPAEIDLPAGTVFLARIHATQQGAH